MIRSGNPALRGDVFGVPSDVGVNRGRGGGSMSPVSEGVMTVQGTVNKSFILLLLALATASLTWWQVFSGNGQVASLAMIGGGIGGLVFALITIFKRTAAPITAPLYALAEGFVLGGASALYEARYPGLVIQAVGLTFAVFAGLLFVYKARIVQATENFKLGVFAATAGIALMYLVTFVLGLFGVHMGFLHDGSPMSIGISLVIVVVAALNLVMDFDFIEQGAAARAPSHMEWYGAFGLMVTLVWLYLEMLRLLGNLRRRD